MVVDSSPNVETQAGDVSGHSNKYISITMVKFLRKGIIYKGIRQQWMSAYQSVVPVRLQIVPMKRVLDLRNLSGIISRSCDIILSIRCWYDESIKHYWRRVTVDWIIKQPQNAPFQFINKFNSIAGLNGFLILLSISWSSVYEQQLMLLLILWYAPFMPYSEIYLILYLWSRRHSSNDILDHLLTIFILNLKNYK